MPKRGKLSQAPSSGSMTAHTTWWHTFRGRGLHGHAARPLRAEDQLGQLDASQTILKQSSDARSSNLPRQNAARFGRRWSYQLLLGVTEATWFLCLYAPERQTLSGAKCDYVGHVATT